MDSSGSSVDANDDFLMEEYNKNSTLKELLESSTLDIRPNDCLPRRQHFPLLFVLLVDDAFAWSKHIMKPICACCDLVTSWF